MKILINVPYTGGRGGLETVLINILNTNFSSEHEIILHTGNTPYKEWFDSIPDSVTKIMCKSNKLIDRLHSLYQVLKKNKDIDVIIDTGRGRSIYADYMLRKVMNRKFRIISWYHLSLNAYETQKKYFKYADSFLAISSEIKDQLLEIGIPENKINLIFNPVLPKKAIPLSENEVFKFAYVGRLHEEQKNLKELFTGLSILDPKSYQLDIYGEGPQIEEQKCWAEEMKVNANWHGWFKNPWEEVEKNGVNAIIMTSNYEGFSMVMCEAISMGIPVLSSDYVSGPRDIIKDGVNGYLYHLHDIDDFVSKLKMMMDKGRNWNQEEIQQSISYAYLDNYIKNLDEELIQ